MEDEKKADEGSCQKMASGAEMNPHAHRLWEGREGWSLKRFVVALGEDGLTGHR